jgi:two-component system sensor histidine kinase KdpD
MDEIVHTLARNFVDAFGLPLAIVLSEGDQVSVRFCSPTLVLDESDFATARLAIECGRRVGRGTADLPHSRSSFVPLSTWQGPVGAIGFKGASDQEWIAADEWPIVENFANQAALAVLRARLGEQAQRAAVLANADKLQKALLNSISHNVRTPLASIIGGLSTLQEDECAHTLNDWTRRELVDTARAEAERLNHLLTNLLDMSRLDAGVVPMRLDPCEVEDVIGAALEQTRCSKSPAFYTGGHRPGSAVHTHGLCTDRAGNRQFAGQRFEVFSLSFSGHGSSTDVRERTGNFGSGRRRGHSGAEPEQRIRKIQSRGSNR